MVRDEKAGMKTVSGLGPTGREVAANVETFRERQNLTFAELSRRTAEAGREVPALGLRRVEALARRVDVDDVLVLAVALGVSPLDLLLPERSDEPVEVTGISGRTGADVWSWALKTAPLDTEKKSRVDKLRRLVARLTAQERDLRIDERAASDRIADLKVELRESAGTGLAAFVAGTVPRSQHEIEQEIRWAERERAEARVTLDDVRPMLARAIRDLEDGLE